MSPTTPTPARRRRIRRIAIATPLLAVAGFARLPIEAASALPAPTPHAQTFTYTGSQQYFTVPSGVTSVTLTLDGAAGGNGESTSVNTPGGAGGLGGRVVENLPVYGGQLLRVGVGGAGQNAGAPFGAGAGGSASGLSGAGGGGGFGNGTDMSTGGSGGGGGAATEVDLVGNQVIGLPDRTVAVAGGGAGGGGTGSIVLYYGGPGGTGGRPAGGGVGGTGPGAGGGGLGGASPNVFGDGGGSAPPASQAGGGGGGGGGYQPSGGGAGTGGAAGTYGEGGGGGGGGGLSFGESTATVYSQAPARGNGDVTVSWSTPAVGQTISSSANPATSGQTVVLTDVVTSSDAAGPAPTGTVTLTRSLGGPPVATGSLVRSGVGSSQVMFRTTFPSTGIGGPFPFYFTYSGDAVYPADTSPKFIESVRPPIPGADLNTSRLAFGAHRVGSTSVKTITIKSGGTAPLVVGQVKTTGAPFSIAGNTCTGKTLSTGRSCAVTVRFHPTKAGSFARALVVTDNAPSSPQHVTLTGSAH